MQWVLPANFSRERQMRHFVALISAGLIALPSSANTQQTLEIAANEFYAWVMTHSDMSLPSAHERTELARFMAPKLIQWLARASEMEARCIKSTPPGDKPNVIE